ncbi:hypothetical protein AXG93_3017s1060 [Marchantia polymorpha subsp. ruderalis]|uniref:Uncharacterized protein n=1 Tax=Marchantia polymorpha subsp. ruderalis TaxID=1480154 RepID=A0A176WJH8_MARPO|nr:hypothetical protein AXG93_3017s1060 [Marchantia polymorpha subsp. ruderalis]
MVTDSVESESNGAVLDFFGHRVEGNGGDPTGPVSEGGPGRLSSDWTRGDNNIEQAEGAWFKTARRGSRLGNAARVGSRERRGHQTRPDENTTALVGSARLRYDLICATVELGRGGEGLELFGDKEARILVLGLDNAGKTTILCILPKSSESKSVLIGFNVVGFSHFLFFRLELGTQSCQRKQSLSLSSIEPIGETTIGAFSKSVSTSEGKALPFQNLQNLQGTSSKSTYVYPVAIGFNVETVQYNNIKFQVWDLGGQTSIRPYWRCYFPNTQAVIYVVDSSDTDRMATAKEEFHAILEEEELKDAVVLIYANKQDLPGALDDASVTEALNLHKIKNRQWAIFKTSAVKGEGLFEGLDWLSDTLKARGR